MAKYWKPFEIDAAERIVTEFSDSVIDLGAGHAHYTDPGRIARLEAAFAPIPNVVLLMPSLDLDRAEEICNERDKERLGKRYDPARADLTRVFVRSECFRRVAKHTVVTEERTVDETLEDVRALLT